jgi:tRNA A-37 threonylcarbamoyl transferase component Bud32
MNASQLQQYLQNGTAIQRIETSNGHVWLKVASKPHPKAGYWLLNLLSKTIGSDLVRAVPNPGGNQSIAIEKERIESLAQHGIKVPEIIDAGDDFILLSHLGDDMRSHLNGMHNVKDRLALLKQVTQSIVKLHQKEQYLSQAFARNITIDSEGQVGFIDFEDDPLTVLKLHQAQARDILLFVNSTAYLFQDSIQVYVESMTRFLSAYSDEIQQELQQASKVMSSLVKLARYNWLGRDIQRSRLMAESLGLILAE